MSQKRRSTWYVLVVVVIRSILMPLQSCLMRITKLLDSIWFGQLQSRDGSIKHSGDNRTGDGDGDDEAIHVDLTQVPSQVKSIVFTISSFRGSNF